MTLPSLCYFVPRCVPTHPPPPPAARAPRPPLRPSLHRYRNRHPIQKPVRRLYNCTCPRQTLRLPTNRCWSQWHVPPISRITTPRPQSRPVPDLDEGGDHTPQPRPVSLRTTCPAAHCDLAPFRSKPPATGQKPTKPTRPIRKRPPQRPKLRVGGKR